MSEVENEAKNTNTEKQVYELGFLLVPTLTPEEVPGIFGNIKELVSSLGGEHISEDMPKMIPLAYKMLKVISNVRNKFDTAYFGWVKFYMTRENILELKKKVDPDSNILRFLILKTVKENTLASKRYTGRDSAYRKTLYTKNENKEAEPINKEEIDKEIEAMVAV